MVTFKQVCGFILMGTTVWMLNTVQGINTQLVTPTLVILVGVALLVWMVGQLYDLSSSASRRWAIRGLAVLTAGPVIALGIRWAHEATTLAALAGPSTSGEIVSHGANDLAWQPFSKTLLDELVASGKPVLMDFTADYCVICKANERLALNTAETKAFVEKHGFVPIVADYTTGSADIRDWLVRFGQDAVPLYVFIPAGQPSKTQVLRGTITQSDVLAKLQETVAHSTAGGTPNTAASNSGKTASLR
jgi:thiol:disulfide interchange protein DsbD